MKRKIYFSARARAGELPPDTDTPDAEAKVTFVPEERGETPMEAGDY